MLFKINTSTHQRIINTSSTHHQDIIKTSSRHQHMWSRKKMKICKKKLVRKNEDFKVHNLHFFSKKSANLHFFLVDQQTPRTVRLFFVAKSSFFSSVIDVAKSTYFFSRFFLGFRFGQSFHQFFLWYVVYFSTLTHTHAHTRTHHTLTRPYTCTCCEDAVINDLQFPLMKL